jgi:hypothetical protein
MKSPRAWFVGKLATPCACSSRRRYRECCYRRESVYFVIGVFTALALFGARELPALLIAVPILLLSAFVAKLHYDRDRRRHQKHENAA